MLQKVKSVYRTLYELSDRMDKHHIYLISAGIAFNILLYIIPLFLVTIFVLSKVISFESILPTLEHLLREILPQTNYSDTMITQILKEIVFVKNNSSTAGWIGLFMLLWLSSVLFSSIRTGLNNIFHIESPRIFVIYRLKDIFLTLVLTLLILVSTFVIPLTSLLVPLIDNIFPEFIEEYVSMLTLQAISLASTFIFFLFIFNLVPNKLPHWKIRLMSTGFSVVLIELSRRIFAWYISGTGNYGKLYGSFAVIVSIAVWLYYSTLILLFSAEISQFIFDRGKRKKA